MDQVVLQWNTHSITNKKQDLLYLINKYNPVILAISEIWLKDGSNFKLPSYSSLMDCRADGRAGCALFIRDHIPFLPVNIAQNYSNFHLTCARVEGITFLSLYIPYPSAIILEQLKKIIENLQHPVIVLGDLNVHHVLWGCDNNDILGEKLLEILDKCNLCLLNSGQATLRTLPNQAASAVDISLCSPILASQITWEVLDSTFGSDHFPIILRSSFVSTKRPTVTKPLQVYNINGADWDSYRKHLHHEVKHLPPITSESTQTCSDALVSAMKISADKVFPLKNTAVGKMASPPWWDKECTAAVKTRKKAELTYAVNMSSENFQLLTKTMAETKALLNSKKSEGWKSFCTTLSPSTPDAIVWNNIRKFRRSFNDSRCPYPTSFQWAESFLDRIAPSYVPGVLDSTIGLLNNNSSDSMDQVFTFLELTNVLKSVKDSAPGHDGIPYSFIVKADDSFQKYFLELINCIFLSGRPPRTWKSQLIMPILKPGKDPNDPRSYRPIALSSVLTKILEHLIKNRLEWFLESQELLGKFQFGFRKGKSTMDSLGIFTSDIRLAFSNQASVVAVFLDVEAAYDNVQLPLLREKFHKLRIPERLACFVGNLLSERQVTFRGKDPNIDPSRLVWRGLPQGSVLSPLLYNMFTYDLEGSVTDCQILQYADDLLVYSANKSIITACETINKSLQSLNTWLTNNGLSLSPSKSCAVVFTRKIALPTINITINNSSIPVRTSYKFLGIILDSKLNGTSHFEYLIKKSERGLNTLRCLSGVWWGAHPTSLRLIYNATVRSILDYGSFLLVPANKEGLVKLDRVQYKALRIILGAMKSSPTNALQVECAEPPLKIRRQFLADSYFYRALQFSYHPIIHRLYDLKAASRWNEEELPCLVKSLTKFQNLKDPVFHSSRLPLFEFSYEIVIHHPRIILNMDICHEDPHADEYLRQILSREWLGWNTIYCDASKLAPTGCVGVGVFHSQYDIVQKIKCPPETSVFTGECIGILESVKYILIFNLKKSIIFSDSRSGLQALLSNPFSVRFHNPIVYQIKENLIKCRNRGYEVVLAWVPGHTGVTGNERADQVAKEAVVCGDKTPFRNYCHDLVPLAASYLIQAWSVDWKASSKKRAQTYALVQPTVSRKPWFAKLFLPKPFCSIVIRMRLGHCCTPVHLKKIHIRDSSLCECGLDDGDLNHIFFACPLYSHNCFYDELIRLKVPLPTHILELIQIKNKDILMALGSFCQRNNLKL